MTFDMPSVIVCVCNFWHRGWMNSYPKKKVFLNGSCLYRKREKETRKPINITSPLGAISEKANRLRNLCSLLYRVYSIYILCKTASIPNWYEWDQSHLPLLASHTAISYYFSDTFKKNIIWTITTNKNKNVCRSFHFRQMAANLTHRSGEMSFVWKSSNYW